MKKKILKSILLFFILLSLVGTSVVFAETSIGAFSFEFYNNVVGKTKFDCRIKKQHVEVKLANIEKMYGMIMNNSITKLI